MRARYISIIIIAFSQPVHAYIDPGTGSLILQSIIAAIAGAIVVIRFYWHKVTTFFKRNQDSNNDKEKNGDVGT